jgi:D-tagatose-1,6-bisphosphate aldolase subunit GatZ/KbaZ
MIATDNKLLFLITQHKSGRPLGITSICSANTFVIKAAILNAKKNSKMVLIESTSNQVDQFGGYSGLTPEEFKESVLDIARQVSYPVENIILGGDHLGPNRWQNENLDSAFKKAIDQVSAYVAAGFNKIHLDATMKCADDGNPVTALSPLMIAERTAILCKASEESYNSTKKEFDPPVYIIGTDVPPPGGANLAKSDFHITSTEEVEETIRLTKNAFEKHGLDDAWERVIGVVVQPGVEFGDDEIFDYERKNTSGLKRLIENKENLVYEAHSTDYQKKENLKQMVEDHFAILKVGPWLTFAFREAVFALALIEKEYLSNKKNISLSNLFQILEDRMIKEPVYWKKYYKGDEARKKFKMKYSYSDRIRYYWNDNYVKESFSTLLSNLTENKIPHTLISQFLPEEYKLIKNGSLTENPEELIIKRITDVLEIYNYATNGGNS